MLSVIRMEDLQYKQKLKFIGTYIYYVTVVSILPKHQYNRYILNILRHKSIV